MTMRRSLIVVGLALTVSAGCSGPRKTKSLFNTERVVEAAFHQFWQAELPLERGERVRACYLVDDNLYVTTDRGMICAVEAQKGLLRWCERVTKPDYTIFPPRHLQTSDGRGPVAVVTTTRLYVLERYSGDTLMSSDIAFPPGSGAVGDETRLYLGGLDGHLYSLLWRHAFGTDPLERWRVSTVAPVSTTPTLLRSGVLVFAAQNGRVSAATAVDKGGLWIFATEAGILAAPYVTRDSVYVSSLDRSLYRVDLHTGRQLWRLRTTQPLTQGPVVVGDDCYQFIPGQGLTSVETDRGVIRWSRKDAVQFVSSTGNRVTLLLENGEFCVADRRTGETLRTIPAEARVIAVTNDLTDAVYAVSPDGRISCIRPDSNPYLRHQEVEASRAYLHRPPTNGDQRDEAPASGRRTPRHHDPFRSRMDR